MKQTGEKTNSMSKRLIGNKRISCLQCLLLSVALLSLIILGTIFIFMFIGFSSDGGVQITRQNLREWVELDLFTPYILNPEPEGVELVFGPTLISSSYLSSLFPPQFAENPVRAELYYSERFTADGLQHTYKLYVSNGPMPDHLFKPHYDIPDEDVTETHTTLVIEGNEQKIKIRLNRTLPEEGIAFFEIDETHVLLHWVSMGQDVALKVLSEHLVSIQQDDIEIISEFDRLQKDSRRYRNQPTKEFSKEFID